jgi:hypothetical protein
LAVSCLIDWRASRHARIFVSEQQTTSLIRAVDARATGGGCAETSGVAKIGERWRSAKTSSRRVARHRVDWR